MAQQPEILTYLLNAPPRRRDEAWAAFLREFTPLLLHVARAVTTERDETMDAYGVILDALRSEDYRRLRGYSVDPRAKFTTWLVVVARRICVDHYRSRYGRSRQLASPEERERLALRKRLENLDSPIEDVSTVIDEASLEPDAELTAAEIRAGLNSAVATLNPPDRLLLALRFDDGRSAAEIATILKFPSQFHVYRRINTVLATLRELLRERGIESAAS
jgi:RNA polymerase sigma factor, sigma-70 family